MNLYEVMYIVKPDIEGDDQEEAITRVSDVLEKEGSTIELVKRIGKRKLAYEINDYKDGYYVLLNVRGTPGIVPALEHYFRVSEGYLRYLVIRLDDAEQKEVVEEKKEESSDVNENAAVEEVPANEQQ